MYSANGLNMLQPEGLPSDVVSFVTTRDGGNSTKPYDSMNMAYHVGDDPVAVRQNYDLLKKMCGIDDVQLVTQTHSDIIFECDKYTELRPEADGIYTRTSGLPIGILTADCYTVQLIGSEGVCNLHCGWRSLFDGIIEKGITLFERDQDMIRHAVIGPGICGGCYEVNPELAQQFYERYPFDHIYTELNDKIQLNLRQVAVGILNLKGIYSILHNNNCTLCDSHLYSHRGDNGHTGRMLSVLMKK